MKARDPKHSLRYYTWPAGIVVFFAAVIAVNVTLLKLALSSSSRSRLIEDQPYERGLEFQNVVDAKERFRALGWSLQLSQEAGRLTALLRDRDGAPVREASIILKAIHPAEPGHDRHLELLESAHQPGVYTTGFAGPDARWLLKFTISLGGLILKDERTL